MRYKIWITLIVCGTLLALAPPISDYLAARRCFSIRMCSRQLELSEMIEDFAAESSFGDLIG
jgi:hypothetical protein